MRENEGKKTYIGGGEESYGYVPEVFVRDKDAVSSLALIAEMAAWAKDNGMSVYDLLKKVYAEFGYSKEKGVSLVKKGKAGADEIKQMMADYRSNTPKEIAGSPVVLYKDYASLVQRENGKETKITGMPTTSDVIQLFTEDGTKISIRPSGTEPKIKYYIEVRSDMKSVADYDKATAAAEAKIDAVRKSLGI
jgi:phosphoglucomutase